jgi:hypothetical protein
VHFDAAESADVTLVLDWGTQVVEGVVRDEDGEAIGGANVTLSWSMKIEGGQSSSIRHTVTDSSGAFSFSELSAVEHRISASAPEFKSEQTAVSVGRGEVVEIELSPR